VYILASGIHGTLYIGVTSNLASRIEQHETKSISGFTSKYNVTRLVWSEEFEDMPTAIQREKTMKKWLRAWKIELIEKTNPHWHRLPFSACRAVCAFGMRRRHSILR